MPTRPLLALPIEISGGPHLQIDYDDPAPGSFSITIPTGTYVLDDGDDSEDLLKAIETKLNAWLVANNRDGTWTVQAPATGLAWRVEILWDTEPSRDGNGLGPSTLTLLTSGLTTVDLGLAQTVGSPDEVLVESPPTPGDPYAFRGLYQRRWIWYPNDLLLRNERYRRAEVVSSVSPFGGTPTVDEYGEVVERLIAVEFVRGARVYAFAADDPELRQGVEHAQTADPNLPLERLWRDYRAGVSNGTPPLLRVYPDATDATDYVEVYWADQEQLRDLRNVTGDEQTPSPLRYRVRLRFLEVAS